MVSQEKIHHFQSIHSNRKWHVPFLATAPGSGVAETPPNQEQSPGSLLPEQLRACPLLMGVSLQVVHCLVKGTTSQLQLWHRPQPEAKVHCCWFFQDLTENWIQLCGSNLVTLRKSQSWSGISCSAINYLCKDTTEHFQSDQLQQNCSLHSFLLGCLYSYKDTDMWMSVLTSLGSCWSLVLMDMVAEM